MPPIPLEYLGRELVARFLAAAIFRPGFAFRVVPTRVNGQPALGMYLREPADAVAHAKGVMVFTLAGDGISAMTRFDTTVLPLVRTCANIARVNARRDKPGCSVVPRRKAAQPCDYSCSVALARRLIR
jgi:hypothetical protein